MDYIPLVAAASALFGVIAGGMISHFSNSKLKNIELRHKLASEIVREKRNTYTEFLCAINESATKLLSKQPDSFDLFHPVSASLAKVEIIADKEVFEAARKLSALILDFYDKENKANMLPELREAYVSAVKGELSDYT